MTAQSSRPFMTVEEYLQLDRNSMDARYEYIDGQVRMLAGGSVNHSIIGVNVTSTLHRLLRGTPCRVYNSDIRVYVSETRYFYPDATVSCNERNQGDDDTIHAPRLIVEVLSSSTEAFDRGQKFAFYRACPTIQEYVLIGSERLSIELFRRVKNNLWMLQTFGPDDDVQLNSLDISISASALYENVVFPEGDNQPA
ncbi:MAG TPA: Uma2 family endonuclease [Ktedonobacteraceae bacterium]|nr:Uma2 family endonuclease [Ktedonobacteraceae bacterium]